MKRPVSILTVVLVVLSVGFVALPLVSATCETEMLGCRHVIKVIPVGATETGDPMVTNNPADLMMFHTGQGPIRNVWLLMVLNAPTYAALKKITINGTTFMTKADFALVTAKKIPPTSPNPSSGYPGSLCQYEVTAIKDKMDEIGKPVYYGVKFFLDQISKSPKHFTLALELDSSISNPKALILALGRYDRCLTKAEIECSRFRPFNACSAFSKSTLVVPEVATLAITAASFGALGIVYRARRKK